MNLIPLLAGSILALSLISSAVADTKVKVRLQSKVDQVSLSGFQVKMPYDEVTPHPRITFETRKIKLRRILQAGQIVWEISDSLHAEKIYWRDEPIKIQGEMMRQGVDALPRNLIFYPLDTKAFDVVASMDMESYLSGVLPSEMPSSWPMEALKAQVVASRSYMLSLMKERKHQHFQLESSIFDQVYNHSNRVDVSKSVQNRMLKAIRATDGDILLSNEGDVYRTFYHADCGGQTEEPQHVWGMPLKNGTVADENCPASPRAKWKLELSRNSLKKYLREYFGWKKNHKFKAILVAQRTPSGRVAQLDVLSEGGKIDRISAQEFRRIIGFNRLKSTNFSLTWFGDSLRVEGQGHGHGVGMCQWGARFLANKGVDYKSILKRYYPYAQFGKAPGQKKISPEKITANL